MKKMFVLGALIFICGSPMAFSAEPQAGKKEGPGKMSPPTPEMREKMAVNHEKMAACLRSDTDMKECHKEMKKQCHETMGDTCPMMGMMGPKGKGRHGHGDHDDD
ncbi:MAG: hypothetical protein ABL958_09125 [Bdellovibrionia bacterium]